MSNWDNLNINIGYAGDFENQSANTTGSDTVCIPSSSHAATFSPASFKPTTRDNTETLNPLTTIVVSSLEKFRDFLDTVTFCGLVLSFMTFILALISAGVFGPLNEHYGIMKDAYSYACYAGVYSLLSCFALGILYAIVHPE